MKKILKIIAGLFLSAIAGFVVGGSYLYDTLDKKYGNIINGLGAELRYQSFEKNKEILGALNSGDSEMARKLLEKRMAFEYEVVEKCVNSDCVNFVGLSGISREWVDNNRSNKTN